MQAKFGIERELHNELFYRECENDSGDFHFHSQLELCLVTDGEMEVLVNGKKKNLKKGEMSVALSYDSHFYKPVNYSKSCVLIIPLHMCNEFTLVISNRKVVNPFICNPDITSVIKEYFDKLTKEKYNEVTARGYIYVILGLIMDNVCLEFVDDPIEKEFSSKILFYIHENYNEEISLSSISRKFGYNQSYISKHFKTRFNIGIKQYITLVRLRNAIVLMQKKKHDITYCALESGFNSVRTFYRAFLSEFGCSPKEYFKQDNSK